MKKSLIALAALSAFATAAQAQSSVSVYGVLDIGMNETKTTVTNANGTGNAAATAGTTKRSNTGNGDGGLATSRLGFKGSEDLGGGDKANFVLEYDLVDVGTGGQTFGARESWVGLESAKAGQIKLGRQATLTHGVITGFSAGYANNTAGAIYSAGTGAANTASPNAASIRPHVVFADRTIAYVSPNLNGLVLGVAYGKDKTAPVTEAGVNTTTESKLIDLSANYTVGKLKAGVSRQEVKSAQAAGYGSTAGANGAANQATAAANLNGTVGWSTNNFLSFDAVANTLTNATAIREVKTVLNAAGASYDFGVIQPFALYTQKKADATGTTADSTGRIYKQTATEVGFRAPLMAKVNAFASTYRGDIKYGNDGIDGNDLKGYQLGATYDFSKRTTAYVITGKQEVTGTNGDLFSGEVKQTNIGIRHSF